MKESHVRSFIKGTTWRIIGTADTIFLSYIFTGNIGTALKIGFVELFTKIILFYIHERIWMTYHIGQTIIAESSTENNIHYKDKHWRSLVKGISWRFFGTMDTIIIATFVTHQFSKAFAIGFTEVFTKVGLYYLHERVWLKIKWGKIA
ncbi:MAG: DUF2061 domain-containing protein [Bacteroidota bacterium]